MIHTTILICLIVSFVNCIHDKPKEKSEERWNKDFKKFCDDTDMSKEERDERDFFDNCIQENDECLSKCVSKVYNVQKLPSTQDEITKLMCKGEFGTLKKFKDRDQCFLKCDDPNDKVGKYCDEITDQKYPDAGDKETRQ